MPVGVEFMELPEAGVELWVELNVREVKVLLTDDEVVAKFRMNLD